MENPTFDGLNFKITSNLAIEAFLSLRLGWVKLKNILDRKEEEFMYSPVSTSSTVVASRREGAEEITVGIEGESHKTVLRISNTTLRTMLAIKKIAKKYDILILESEESVIRVDGWIYFDFKQLFISS